MSRSVLSRALRGGGVTLPVPWPALASKVEPEPGFLVLCIGAATAGKSTFGLAWAYAIGRPALFVSLDTDLRSQALRVAAMLRHLPVDQVKQNPDTHSAWLARQRYPVRWSDTPISAKELGEVLEAEREYGGTYPELVVLDSLGDFVKEETYESYVNTLSDLKKCAKKYKTVILALHHLHKGADPTATVDLADVLYSGDKQPEIVLGICRPTPDVMRVSINKNRMGACSRDGNFYAELACDMSMAQVRSFTQIEEYTRSFKGAGT